MKKRKKTFDEVDDIIAHYADKIGGDDPADVQKWKEERRRSYPTRNNVERKEAEAKERRDRGEIGETEGRGGEVDRFGSARGGRGAKRSRGGGRDGGGQDGGRGRGRDWRGRGRGGRGGWKGAWNSDQAADVHMDDDVHDVERKEATTSTAPSMVSQAADEHKEQTSDISTSLTSTTVLSSADSSTSGVAFNPSLLSASLPPSSSVQPDDVDDDDAPPDSLPLTLAPAQLERLQQQQQAEDARRLAQQQQCSQQREAVEAEREWRQQRVNVCRYYVNNECKRGDECEWPHEEEARREVLLRRQMNDARSAGGGRGRGRSRGGAGGGGGGGALRQPQASDELLSDLLRDERRKESSVILQCIRYIVNNNFLQPLDKPQHTHVEPDGQPAEEPSNVEVVENQQATS